DRYSLLRAGGVWAVDGHGQRGRARTAVKQEQQLQQALVKPIDLDLLDLEQAPDTLPPRVLDRHALTQVGTGDRKVVGDQRRVEGRVQRHRIADPPLPLILHGLQVKPDRRGLPVAVAHRGQAIPNRYHHQRPVDPDGTGQPIRILGLREVTVAADLRGEPAQVTDVLGGYVERRLVRHGADDRVGVPQP